MCDSNHLPSEYFLCPNSRAFPNYNLGAAAHPKELTIDGRSWANVL